MLFNVLLEIYETSQQYVLERGLLWGLKEEVNAEKKEKAIT